LKRRYLLFVIGLLISITVFSSEALAQEIYSIPQWIKNNAKWWSEGQIVDSDFIKGIQYLMQNGIMKIPTSIPNMLISLVP